MKSDIEGRSELVHQLRELARIEEDPEKRIAIMERINEMQEAPRENED